MIEYHSGPKVGSNPYEHDPMMDLDYSAKFLADQQSHMIAMLDRLVNYSERQRETKAPDVIDLSPASGSQTATTYTTKTGLRVLGLIISGQPATDSYKLTVGARPYLFFGATVRFMPFPIEVTNGIDLTMVNVTTPNSITWSCYVFGYPF